MDYKDYQEGASQDFCWFKAKNELIAVLLKKLKTKKKLKILNLGAGTGDDLPILSGFGDIYVIDTDHNALKLISDKFIAEKKISDACDIDYPQGFFDLVVAFDVLEHIKDDGLAISEINRVLKPEGFFIFTVPAFNFLFSSHDRNLNHHRRYNKKTISNLLSDLKCKELGYWVFTLFVPIALQRMMKDNEFSQASDFVKLPTSVNNLFYNILKIENWIIKHEIPLPVGLTIYGIYQKY